MKKLLALLFIIMFLVVSCSPNKHNTPKSEQRQLLTKTLQGEPTEVKTVAIVFNRLYSLPELEKLLKNSNLELEAWRYYSGGISGTMTFESKYLNDKIIEFKNWIIEVSADRKAHEKDIIQTELSHVTQTMFVASTELQDLSKSLINNIKQRKIVLQTIKSDGPIVFAIIVRGSVSKIEEIARRTGYEGLLDYKAIQDVGGRAIVPYPAFMEAAMEKDFNRRYILTSSMELFNTVSRTLEEEYGIQLGVE